MTISSKKRISKLILNNFEHLLQNPKELSTILLPWNNHWWNNIIDLRIVWWIPTYLWDTINQGKRGRPLLPRMYGLIPSCSCSIANNFPSLQLQWPNDTKKISTKLKHHSLNQKHQKNILKPFAMINYCLHLDVVTFRLEWIKINNKKILTLWFLQMDLCCINGTMN
jgi:hypothetical protein